MGGQLAAKAIEQGENDSLIAHMFDCRGEYDPREVHVIINVPTLTKQKIAYARVQWSCLCVLRPCVSGLAELKFETEVGRVLQTTHYVTSNTLNT